MTTKRMKSNEARRDWAEVLQHVRQGGTVIIEHYNRPIATIAPYEGPTDAAPPSAGPWRSAHEAAGDVGSP